MFRPLVMTSLFLASFALNAASLKEVPEHYNIEDFTGKTYAAIDSVDFVKIVLNKELILSGQHGISISESDGYACHLSSVDSKKIVLAKGTTLEAKAEFRAAYIEWSNRDDGKEIILTDAKKNEYLLQCGSIGKGHDAYYYGEGADNYHADMKTCNSHHGMVTEVVTGPALFREATRIEKLQDLALGTVKYNNGMSGVSRSKGYYIECSHYPHKVSDVKNMFERAGMNLKLFTLN